MFWYSSLEHELDLSANFQQERDAEVFVCDFQDQSMKVIAASIFLSLDHFLWGNSAALS